MAPFTVGTKRVNVVQWHEYQQKKLVVLHGFTGTAQGWSDLAEQLTDVHVIAIDMMGHGQSEVPTDTKDYEMAIQIEVIREVLKLLHIQQFFLLGYSMGGRIALSYAVKYPQQIKKLLLESASPGLKDESSRQERITADNALADFIEHEGIEAFVKRWENIPLFATQKILPAEVQEKIRAERLSQQPSGLANSLRGIGTGRMPSVWAQLATLPMPVHILVGELDLKFINIANEMKMYIQNVEITEFLGCGHTIHVENLWQFATIVKESISKQ